MTDRPARGGAPGTTLAATLAGHGTAGLRCRRTLLAAAPALALAMALAGCGQKGPLRLPDTLQPATQAPGAQGVPENPEITKRPPARATTAPAASSTTTESSR